MAYPSILELKIYLRSKGFEIYRLFGDKVFLAERVRDNLLMDGNVAASTGLRLQLEFTTRAQQSDFPAETDAQLFERARDCAGEALDRGYREVGVAAVPVVDPGDRERTLDMWHEVSFVRGLSDLDELAREATFALGLNKIARRL